MYATSDVLEASAAIHCPRVEMASRSKLSCVVWNSYIKVRGAGLTGLPAFSRQILRQKLIPGCGVLCQGCSCHDSA